METLEELTKWTVYSFLCAVADVLDTVMTAVAPSSKPRPSLPPSDTDVLTDEEIIDLLGKALQLDLEEDAGDASEANALNLVYAKTTIPVPRVHRVIKYEWGYLIVMDYIRGQTLAELWSTFSVWKKIRVALTLRSYIRQLRHLKASPTTPPGPPSADGPRKCEIPSFFGQIQSSRGPFASYAELSSFFNARHKMGMDYRDVPEDHPWRREPFDDSSPLVLSHMDLNPRNIIEDEDGRLWLIDFAWSGYYPPWFEYVAMLNQVENEKTVGFQDRFWEIMIPFVCGPYFKQREWLMRMGTAFNYK